MQIVLKQKEARGRRKNRLQERFDELRVALERQQRRHDRFRKDLDGLVEVYRQRSLENDRAVFRERVDLADKLISFAGRKSLSDWHRVEIDDWLRGLIERRIAPVDSEIASRLLVSYREAIARSLDLSLDELDEHLGRAEAGGEGESAEKGQGTANDDDDRQQEDLFGFDGCDPEAEAFDEDFGAEEPACVDDDDAIPIGRALMDGSWAKDLFRRAAQILHPDRESDHERRQAKQDLMRELLRARKSGDIMALLTIYGESVSATDIVVPEEEMLAICETLEGQLLALEAEKQAYIHTHPLRHMVFQMFYHSTRRGQTQRIREWERSLKSEKAQLRDLVAFLRNLSCLKTVLEDRREERSALLADLFFDEL